MGLFDGKPAKRKRGQHGPPRAGSDRLAAAKARAINMALAKRPELAERIALVELGIAQGDPIDPFDRFLDQFEKFRGVVPDVRDVDKPPGIDWAQAIAGALALFAKMQGGAPGVAATSPPQAATPPPAPPVAEAATPVDGVPVAERRRTDPLGEPSTWQSRLAHATLLGATPGEAAQVLAAHPNGAELVGYLVATPDGELVSYLNRVGMKHPELAPLIRWAVLDPEWTVAVVGELRLLAGQRAG
jgi:hypothetical protein